MLHPFRHDINNKIIINNKNNNNCNYAYIEHIIYLLYIHTGDGKLPM